VRSCDRHRQSCSSQRWRIRLNRQGWFCVSWVFVCFHLPPEFSRLQFTQFVAILAQSLHAIIVVVGGALTPAELRVFAKPVSAAGYNSYRDSNFAAQRLFPALFEFARDATRTLRYVIRILGCRLAKVVQLLFIP